MKNVICKNCEAEFSNALEFCPKRGYYNDLSESSSEETTIDYNQRLKPKAINEILISILEAINVVKNILIFFLILWILGVIIYLYNYLTHLL